MNDRLLKDFHKGSQSGRFFSGSGFRGRVRVWETSGFFRVSCGFFGFRTDIKSRIAEAEFFHSYDKSLELVAKDDAPERRFFLFYFSIGHLIIPKIDFEVETLAKNQHFGAILRLFFSSEKALK